MPEVSVIIPTHNRAHLISRAIQSVLAQTFQGFELIIIDDFSTDGTENIIKGFSDPRIRYLRLEENLGASAARNAGIKIASGRYIAFLDSDDEWLPEKLMKQLTVFTAGSYELGAVYTAFRKEDWPIQPEPPRHRGRIYNFLLTGNFIGTCSTVMAKRECFGKVGVFEETWKQAEDWDMWLRIAREYEIDFIGEVLVRYYHQSQSLSMDKKGYGESLKKYSRRYEPTIKTLPRKLRAEYYFYIGENSWWNTDILKSLSYFARAAAENPALWPRIFDFLISRLQKILFHHRF